MTRPEQAWHDWCAQRDAGLTGPAGNLALVGWQPVGPEPARIEGLPATVRSVPELDGVLVTAWAADGVTLDGEPVVGEVPVGRLRPDGTPLLRWGGTTVDVFSLSPWSPAGTDFELRRYDAAAPRRAAFAGVQRYPYDPALVVRGRLRRFEETADVPWDFTRAADTGHVKRVPGVVEAEVGGEAVRLRAFLDGPALVLVFADGTTGAESYAPGRFLRVEADDSDPGAVVLDFNRAFIPPCGFSDFYSCPVPPAGNRLTVPVRAGEQRVRWSDQAGG